MSMLQKKIILIMSGILILVLTFFLVFQQNQETVFQLETETRAYQSQVSHLSDLQVYVNQMSKMAPAQKKTVDNLNNKFPSKMTQQKVIYNLYQMMRKSGIRITAITPGEAQTFFQNGTFIESGNVAAVSASAVEANPESKVNMDQMIGKQSLYEVQLTGSLKQIVKAIDWASDSDEPITIWNISLSYDASTGELSGSLSIGFNELNGNGQDYKDPDISDISIGIDNISKLFGTSGK